MAETSTLDKIISPVTQYVSDTASDFYKSIKKGIGYAPDKQQLAEWKSARQFENVYKSPEYNAMPPEKKALFEKHMFDTQIKPSFDSVGRKAPDFKQWVQFRTSGDFEKNITKMYDAFDDRTGVWSTYKDIVGRETRSVTGLAENLYINGIMDKKSQKKGDTVTHWFDNLKAAESHFIDKNSPVTSSWSRKLFENLADNYSDFAVFAALGEVVPELGSVNKVKGADAVVGGMLGKIDLAQDLAQTKLGRFALNRLLGATQGYLYNKTAGTPDKTLENVGIFAMFPQVGDKEIKKLITSQMIMMGPKATIALMNEAVPKEVSEETLGKVKDALTTQLTKANAKIYNDASKQFGHSIYQFAPKEIKTKVLAIIYSNIAEILKNPLAHADPELQKFMVEHDLMERLTPEMSAGFRQSAEAMAKSGEKPSTKYLVDEKVAMAKLETAEHNPRVAAQQNLPSFRIGRGSDKGQVKVVFPNQSMADLYAYKGRVSRQFENVPTKDPLRQQLKDKFGSDLYSKSDQYRKQIHENIKNLEEDSVHYAHSFGDSPDRIVPGAASGKSPEFKENLPKAEMRLEGDVNKYAYALGHYMQKSPKSPYVKMMLDKLSDELPGMSREQLMQFPAALRQHMEDLQTTGHTSPNDIRGVFRSTNLDAVFGKGRPTEFQDELQEEKEEVQKIVKPSDRKRAKDIIDASKPRNK